MNDSSLILATTDPTVPARERVTAKLRPVTADTTCEGMHSDQAAEELRGAMVNEVIARREEEGLVLPREVEAALRTVPRHLFAPGVPLVCSEQMVRALAVDLLATPS